MIENILASLSLSTVKKGAYHFLKDNPFRMDLNPSLCIDLETGLWFDFGALEEDKKGGNIVKLYALVRGVSLEQSRRELSTFFSYGDRGSGFEFFESIGEEELLKWLDLQYEISSIAYKNSLALKKIKVLEKLVSHYIYRDFYGRAVKVVLRYDVYKKEKTESGGFMLSYKEKKIYPFAKSSSTSSICANGKLNMLFNLDKMHAGLADESTSILFVEGEKCVKAVEEYIGRQKDLELSKMIVTTTGSKSSIKGANLSILSKFKKIFIFNDNDDGTKESWVDKIILKIRNNLKQEIDIYVIDQEYLRGQTRGFDIADLIESNARFNLKEFMSSHFLKVERKVYDDGSRLTKIPEESLHESYIGLILYKYFLKDGGYLACTNKDGRLFEFSLKILSRDEVFFLVSSEYQSYFKNRNKKGALEEIITNVKKHFDKAPYKDDCVFHGIGIHKIGKNVVFYDGKDFYNFSKDISASAYEFNKTSLWSGTNLYFVKGEQKAIPSKIVSSKLAEKEDFEEFFSLMDKFYFKNKTQNALALGWICIALIPSFLPKLAYLSINGAARTGKTFFVKNIMMPCLQGLLKKSTGDDTRASLEETYNKSTLPIWIEEFERNKDKNSEFSLADFLSILRIAFDNDGNASKKKMTKNSEVKEIHLKSNIVTTSIDLFTQDSALIERINFVDLSSFTNKEKLNSMRERLLRYFEEKNMKDVASKVLKNIVLNAFVIEELSKDFMELITKEYGDSSASARSCSLVAGLYYVYSQFTESPSKKMFVRTYFPELVDRFMEEEDVIKDFLELRIRHESSYSSVNNLISNCINGIDAIESNNSLKQYGIKFQESGGALLFSKLYIAKSSKRLEYAFKESGARFYDNYAKKLSSVPQEMILSKSGKVKFMGTYVTSSLVLDFSKIRKVYFTGKRSETKTKI